MKDYAQTLHSFWSAFGLPAYDENTVPDRTAFPYITYNVTAAAFNETVTMSASLWYRSTSWKEITDKAEQIRETLEDGGRYIVTNKGALWIKTGVPFAQRMSDVDDSVRRIYINIEVDYIEY